MILIKNPVMAVVSDQELHFFKSAEFRILLEYLFEIPHEIILESEHFGDEEMFVSRKIFKLDTRYLELEFLFQICNHTTG